MQALFQKYNSINDQEIILMDLEFDKLGSTNNLSVLLQESEYAAIRDCIHHEKEWN